ncbi:hypothetical protein [Microscilla marina]|nr:hypothetical protein [Microscilla marina]
MNQAIKTAIDKVRGNDFVSYFEIMEQIVPTSKRAMFSQLRSKFNSDRTSVHFDQQLIVFAREVEKLVADEDSVPAQSGSSDKVAIDAVKLKKLIAQGQLQVVINELTDALGTPQTKDLFNRVVVISANLNSLNSLTMTHDEISRKQSQLTMEVLNIINEIE